MWSAIRKLTGAKSQLPSHLSYLFNQALNTPEAVTESLAQLYADISADSNYDPDFLTTKTQAEYTSPDFSSPNADNLPYNAPISEAEILRAIASTSKRSSPGPDQITNTMLQHLHPNAINLLTDLLNRIFFLSQFPQQWKIATVIPILKPLKDPHSLLSYRPISLLSSLSKILEKIINTRLSWYLEGTNFLSPLQYGCRKGKSTLMAITDLDSQIRNAFLNKSKLHVLFFDLENAFPRVWKHLISLSLHAAGLRGPLPLLLLSFLQERTFKVRIANHFSSEHPQSNGIPQGSPLSGTLFILAINDIFSVIPPPIRAILYADDLSIQLQSNFTPRACRLLQSTINEIHAWLSARGFRISPTKSLQITFQRHCKHPPPLPLQLGSTAIPQTTSTKFLGMHFHASHSWLPHIKIIKAKAARALNILKVLAHPSKGCNRKVLLPLYTSLVRSILDYGAPVYGLAAPSHLKLLDPIQNTAIRIATGAFRTSPATSLAAESGLPPLHFRRLALTAKFLSTASAHPALPIHKQLFETLRQDPNTPHLRYSLCRELSHSFRFHSLPPITISTPPWLLTPPPTIFSLNEHPKNTTPPSVYRSLFAEIIHRFRHAIICFTDGSKSNGRVGFAYSIQDQEFSHRHRNSASVFTAELDAILHCLTNISNRAPNQEYLIVSDSLAALTALQDTYTTHPLVQRIQALLASLATSATPISFCWAPGHCGIRGNEVVDQLAKSATLLPKVFPHARVPPADIANLIHLHIYSKWINQWKSLVPEQNLLAQIKPLPGPWLTSNIPQRRLETALTRLRIGHTRVTHTHLVSDLSPLNCRFCLNDDPLTIDHLFTCQALSPYRSSHNVPHSRAQALSDDHVSVLNTFSYLRAIQFLDRI